MENEKVEPSPNQRAIFETYQDKPQQDNKILQDKTQQDNQEFTKHYRTGFALKRLPLPLYRLNAHTKQPSRLQRNKRLFPETHKPHTEGNTRCANSSSTAV
jgi:hypothetical protein